MLVLGGLLLVQILLPLGHRGRLLLLDLVVSDRKQQRAQKQHHRDGLGVDTRLDNLLGLGHVAVAVDEGPRAPERRGPRAHDQRVLVLVHLVDELLQLRQLRHQLLLLLQHFPQVRALVLFLVERERAVVGVERSNTDGGGGKQRRLDRGVHPRPLRRPAALDAVHEPDGEHSTDGNALEVLVENVVLVGFDFFLG